MAGDQADLAHEVQPGCDLVADGAAGDVDRVRDEFAAEGEQHASGDVGAGAVLGLTGGGAQVRGHDGVGELEERRVGAGLRVEHVERGGPDLAGLEGVDERVLDDEAAAGGVDDHDAVLRAGQTVGVEETGGLLGLGQVHRDDVRARDQLVDVHELDAELRGTGGRQVRVVGDEVGLESGQTLRHELADTAEAHDADGLAEQLNAVEGTALPRVLTQRRVGGRDLAAGGHEQRNGVLGGGVDVGGGRVDHHDAALGGGGDLDVVQADAGTTDDLEVRGGGEHLGVDGRGRTHQDRVGVLDRLEELGAIRAVDPSDLDGVAERIDGRLGELVGDEDDGTSGSCHSGNSSVSIRVRPVYATDPLALPVASAPTRAYRDRSHTPGLAWGATTTR